MTRDRFQRKYHDYRTDAEAEARAEADRVNAEGIDGGETAAVVHLPPFGYCLMLRVAADFLSWLEAPR